MKRIISSRSFSSCHSFTLLAVLSALTYVHNAGGQTNCAPLPSGLVSWWRAEGNATDFAGSNSGTMYGGAGFTDGRVGTAFNFFGSNGHIRVPDRPNLRFTNALTVEG